MRTALDAILVSRDAFDALRAVFAYLLATHRAMSPSRIVRLMENAASGEHRKVVMDVLDVLRQEGRAEGERTGLAKGEHQGRAKLLLTQLTARFGPVPEEAKAKILAAKEATLERWAIRVLTAPTLEAVLGGKAKKTAPARRTAARKRARVS